MLKEILEDTELGMEKSLGALDVAFKKIRTGRATPSLLDSVKVNYYEITLTGDITDGSSTISNIELSGSQLTSSDNVYSGMYLYHFFFS